MSAAPSRPRWRCRSCLWLKRHLRASFDAAGHFFDLADYLTWRATGSTARSMCTVTCKWNYLAHEQRWSAPYFERIGLEDFVAEDYARIGTDIVAPGSPLGMGLTQSAAQDLGLVAGTPVGASLIDAHAGGIGAIGGRDASGRRRQCLRSPGLHHGHVGLHHGDDGRSLLRARRVGTLLFRHGAGLLAQRRRPVGRGRGDRSSAAVASGLCRGKRGGAQRRTSISSISWSSASWRKSEMPARRRCLARDVHVLPEFLGNRSPYADPDSRAVIAGLDLDTDIGAMERLFVAGLCGLAYGLADVIDAFAAHGVETSVIVMAAARRAVRWCGRSWRIPPGSRWRCRRHRSRCCWEPRCSAPSPVAPTGSIGETMASMSALGRLSEPTAPALAAFHRRKRDVHRLLRTLDRDSRKHDAGPRDGEAATNDPHLRRCADRLRPGQGGRWTRGA